ncbi:MAG TPA: sigma-70 family RNA polymerase sigma factor, partial [Acidobacteriota bacterium]|nr:sigma-70 family RNA polymerase sigma factor [Acidobacteriota bacterium]
MQQTKYRASARELRLYFKDVLKYPLLTADEEKALARLVREGDTVALQALIVSNLRFVLKIARMYRHSGVPLADLINEGNLGLIEAAKRFDPDRNNRFTSYAIWWIRQAIVKLLYQATLLRHSQRTANVLYRLAKRNLTGMEDEWDPQRLSHELGFTVNELKRARIARARILSLDSPLDGKDDLVLADVLQQQDRDTVEQLVANRQLKEQLERSLHDLSSREEEVLRMRYGLDHHEPRTLQEIGLLLNLSRERVRQI